MKNIKTILTTCVVGVIVVLTLFIVGAFFISNKIEKEIRNNTFAAFKIQSGEVKTNLLLGKIELTDVELIDSVSSGRINIPKLNIKGISLFPLIFQRKVILDKVSVRGPRFMLTDKMQAPKTSGQNTKKIQSIQIDKLEVTNAELTYMSGSAKPDTTFSSHINLEVWKISTGKQSRYHSKNTSFDRIRMTMDQGTYYFPDQLYRTKYNGFKYDSDTARLAIDKIELLSNDTKYAIGKKEGFETDWFHFVADDFEMKEISLGALLTDTAFILGEIRIKSFEGTAFKDKRLPFPPDKPDSKLPMEMLDDLPFAIHCDSLVIDKAFIRYEERVDDSNSAGFVTFNQLQANIKNLSNIDSLIHAPTTMTATSKVMNESLLHADFIFPNKKFPAAYQAQGSVDPMSMITLNPMLTQNAGIKVEEGHLKQLTFNFQYNAAHASGEVVFEYDGLKISVLNKDDHSSKKTKSFLINTFVVRKENLVENNSFRKGKVSFNRNKKRSIFNYWWKSLSSGLQNTVVL